MVYVMSDLHGEYYAFITMLKEIDFSDNDTLYILGDIFDRGPEPLKILDYIVGHENIILLKGNHEKMFEEAFEYGDYSLWYYNGGQRTHDKLIKAGQDKEQQIYNYIKRLPIIKVVDKFILVHAGLKYPVNCNQLELSDFLKMQSEDDILWTRDNIGAEKQYKDYTVICGHTPIPNIIKINDNSQNKIVYRPGTIYIDCGATFTGKISCLRLDDMQEFYLVRN